MNDKRKHENGQILVLLAIMLAALLAILALVLDGGNLYLNRRTAQNAADAGALAGARIYCLTESTSQAISTAKQYAEVHNGPTNAQVLVGSDIVTVTARITFDTYFAPLIGIPEMAAEATAAAGCFFPTSGVGVLPIAWACRPPIDSSLSTSEDCQQQAITKEQLEYYLDNPPPAGEIHPELYIVMDSNSEPDDLEKSCISNGGWLECDLDGDGEDDLNANGDRSWLDLNGGGGGASELINWINNGYPTIIKAHTWMGGQPGNETTIYHAIANHIGKIFAVPIFDAFCDRYPDPRCADLVHSDDTIVPSSGGNYYYHIAGFAGFYISCVNAPGVPGAECPGHRAARELGTIRANTKTIEGYFIAGVLPQLGGRPGTGIDFGAFALKLIR